MVADVDELRVWRVARTAADIRGEINHRLRGNETGFVALFQAEESFDNQADNRVSTDSPVGTGSFVGVSRVPSGALFAPEIDVTRFIPYQFNTMLLRGFVNPGNLPTDVRFFIGSGLPLSNSPPFAIMNPTNRPVAINWPARNP